jgi:hypothetical protein
MPPPPGDARRRRAGAKSDWRGYGGFHLTRPVETDRIAPVHAASALVVLVVAAVIEWWSGRPAICRCGRVWLWAGSADGPKTSQMVADWYSLSHILHGLLLYAALRFVAPRRAAGARLVAAMLVEAGWELAENSPPVIARYRAATVALGYSGDSILNSMSDVGFMALGFLLARRLPVAASVVLGLALELVALVAIRDNLTLNVLMLVHPIAAIRLWQAG